MGTEFQLEMIKSSGDGFWWWIHDSVNVVNAIELHTKKMVKMVHFMICIFHHNKKETRRELKTQRF